jgi:putative ABC transport system permease protein
VRSLLVTLLVLLAAAARADDAIPDVLVTRQLAAAQGLSVGQVVRVCADAHGADTRRVRIAGVYEPLPDPMRLAATRLEMRFHLPDLAALQPPSDEEPVQGINLALADPADADAVTREIRTRVPNAIVTKTAGTGEVFLVLQRFHLAIALVTLLGSAAFLMALMLMRAEERREVAGVLRLVGFSRRRVLEQSLAEGVVVAAVGALFGVLFSMTSQGAFNAFFRWRYDTALTFVRVTPALGLRCVALALPFGVLSGLAASWALLRREVTELIRR